MEVSRRVSKVRKGDVEGQEWNLRDDMEKERN